MRIDMMRALSLMVVAAVLFMFTSGFAQEPAPAPSPGPAPSPSAPAPSGDSMKSEGTKGTAGEQDKGKHKGKKHGKKHNKSKEGKEGKE